MIRAELRTTELNAYYVKYIDKLADDTKLREGFETGRDATIQFFESVPADKQTYRYAEGKWSIKEVFQHLIDTERIFMNRCFRIARNDKASLAGFDQNIYIEPSMADAKSMEALLGEYRAVRQSFISLLGSLSDKDLRRIGEANGSPMSARTSAFVIIGHEIWHIDIIKERYLND